MNKIFLHSTYLCNANCIHCAVPKNKNSILFEDYKNLVNTASEEGLEFMIIGGGEPLIHKNLEDMIIYGSEKKLKMKIETNGNLLTRRFLNSMKPYLFQINVSLDGVNDKTHDSIRNIQTFNHTTEMISYAREIGIDVAIWSVIMNNNITESNRLIDLAEKLGVNKVSFLYSTPVGSCFNNREELLVNINEYYPVMKKLYNKSNVQVRIAPYVVPFDKRDDFSTEVDREILKTDCMIYDKTSIQIDPLGNIYPCVLLLSREDYKLGNIKDEQTFRNILRGTGFSWNTLLKKLKTQMNESKKEGYTKTGCMGLTAQFKTKIDPRLNEGYILCPCRTINREWSFVS